MPLTKHEKFHLNAILTDMDKNKIQSVSVKEKLAKSKGVLAGDYIAYVDNIKVEAQKILDSGIFPKDLEPSDIHDYLEKS